MAFWKCHTKHWTDSFAHLSGQYLSSAPDANWTLSVDDVQTANIKRWTHKILITMSQFSPLIILSSIRVSYVFIGLVGRVFANGPGNQGSIPGRVIAKNPKKNKKKMVLDTSLLNAQHYKVRIKGKVKKLGGRSSILPTPQCSSYWKGSFRVALNYGCQLYF